MKHFCTAGKVQPDIHYCLSPLQGMNRAELHALIEAQVLHPACSAANRKNQLFTVWGM